MQNMKRQCLRPRGAYDDDYCDYETEINSDSDSSKSIRRSQIRSEEMSVYPKDLRALLRAKGEKRSSMQQLKNDPMTTSDGLPRKIKIEEDADNGMCRPPSAITPQTQSMSSSSSTSSSTLSSSPVPVMASTPAAVNSPSPSAPATATTTTCDPGAPPLLRVLQTLVDDGVDPDNLYYLAECGLQWKSLPASTLAKASLVGRKVSAAQYAAMVRAETLTLAACCSAAGHQLPLLVIGKHPDPRSMKHLRHDLGVVYKAQNPPWLTAFVAQDWLDSHFKKDVELRQQVTGKTGRIVLILEDRAALRKVVCPENVEIRYLPRGELVFKKRFDVLLTGVKRSYRAAQIKLLCNQPSPAVAPRLADLGAVDKFYIDYDLMDCIKLLRESWDEVPLDNLKRIWLQAPVAATLSMMAPCLNQVGGERIIKGEFLRQWMEQAEADEEGDICLKNVINVEEGTEFSDEEVEITHAFETIRKWSKKRPDYTQQTVNSLCNDYYDNYFCKRL
ncbi:tigger transposable element-derived protein 4-like [Frankliniella occidentalis]|uniref:Tigger transposable element-derived protein 4-like n=1 Tax=Frankliniella occidentalis TaxID=133901 RepID=A0A6J1TJ64_FRAOC|nr:tigger transposable element-derived protein 4-like [Frankliniella occidentalis]